MKSHELLEVIGNAQDNYVLDAKEPKKKTIAAVWVRWAAMAACFVLVLGIGITGFDLLKRNNSIPSGESMQNPTKPGEGMENQTQPGIGETNPNGDAVIDRPIIWCNTNSGVEDSGFVEWNGKTITLSLYDALSDEKNKDSLFAIGVGFIIDNNFVYNGKTLANYATEADDERLLYGKLGQLLKLGDSLKYGDALYTTGTPTGEKWAKELYDETIETIGEDIIAKYIVDGEFLVEKLEADIAQCSENETCRIAYDEARNAFFQVAVDQAAKTLEEQNIKYEKRNGTELVFFITADEFASFSLNNVSHFGLALKHSEGLDMAESSAVISPE